MTVLQEVAEEIGAHERTLRRGLSDGLVRGRRPTPRTIELASGEVAYLRVPDLLSTHGLAFPH